MIAALLVAAHVASAPAPYCSAACRDTKALWWQHETAEIKDTERVIRHGREVQQECLGITGIALVLLSGLRLARAFSR